MARFITPSALPGEDVCRPLYIPADSLWLAAFNGALNSLVEAANWEQLNAGDLTPDEAAAAAAAIVDRYFDEGCAEPEPPSSWCLFYDFTIASYSTLWTRTGGNYTAGQGYKGLAGAPVRISLADFWESVRGVEIKFKFTGTGVGGQFKTDIPGIANIQDMAGGNVVHTVTALVTGTGTAKYIEVDPKTGTDTTLISVKLTGIGDVPTDVGVVC